MSQFSSPKIYRLGLRFPKLVLAFSLILSLFAFWGASKLKIVNDLAQLLPQHFESVQGFKKMKLAFGGVGYFAVMVEGENPEQSERFVDAFARAAEKLPIVQYVDARRPIEFFEKRKWLYLDLTDLQEMETRLERSLVLQKQGVSPIFNDFMDFADEADRPDLSFADILEKYEKNEKFKIHPYVRDKDGKRITFRIKPNIHQQQMDESIALLSQLQEIESSLKEKLKLPNLQVTYTGDHLNTMNIMKVLQQRMTWVSIGIVGLLLFVLWVYFRKVRAVFLIGFPLLMGILWTGGFFYLTFGHLNVITGFAAGILAGLGSDYGIYILSRYLEESKKGHNFELSCRLAFASTGKASLLSMWTTVFAFLGLLFSDFRVTFEFGCVGAVGLAFNYLAMMLLLPALLKLNHQRWPLTLTKLASTKSSQNKLERDLNIQPLRFANLYLSAPRVFLSFVVLLFILAAYIVPQLNNFSFEDGRIDPEVIPNYESYAQVKKLYGGTLHPTILLHDNLEENQKSFASFKDILEKNPKDSLPFKDIIGLPSFVPEFQLEKKKIIAKLAKRFSESRYPPKDIRERLQENLTNASKLELVTETNLPQEIRRFFISPKQEGVYATFLFPNYKNLNWAWMKSYAESVRKIRIESNLKFWAVDNPFFASEFVAMIEKESPKMIFATLGCLLLMLFWAVRPWKQAFIIYTHLLLGLILFLGFSWLVGWELNTINMAAFPIILGTGIDCFMHFCLRYEEHHRLPETIQEKLPTILFSNFTTIIGFAGLMFIPSQGLSSLGQTAVLGLIVMTLVCAFVLPRSLKVFLRSH